MRVLVTGAPGLLAGAIVREFAPAWEVRAFSRAELDIADEAAVAAAVEDVRPDAIVNCAAYNHVDAAERDPGAALRANACGVLALARAATRAEAVLVHYGTDFVFDGTTDRPYTEEDRPNPRSAYAVSKLLGEWFALEAPGTYVLRVEALFGEPLPGAKPRGSLATIVDQIARGVPVPVFVDRTVSPTFTDDVARATRLILERRIEPGLYHCVNQGTGSWADVANETARLMGRPIETVPLTLETAKLAAVRPRYGAMSPAKLRAAGIPMPRWEEALRTFLGARVS